jgi:hypothetical protein
MEIGEIKFSQIKIYITIIEIIMFEVVLELIDEHKLIYGIGAIILNLISSIFIEQLIVIIIHLYTVKL